MRATILDMTKATVLGMVKATVTDMIRATLAVTVRATVMGMMKVIVMGNLWQETNNIILKCVVLLGGTAHFFYRSTYIFMKFCPIQSGFFPVT